MGSPRVVCQDNSTWSAVEGSCLRGEQAAHVHMHVFNCNTTCVIPSLCMLRVLQPQCVFEKGDASRTVANELACVPMAMMRPYSHAPKGCSLACATMSVTRTRSLDRLDCGDAWSALVCHGANVLDDNHATPTPVYVCYLSVCCYSLHCSACCSRQRRVQLPIDPCGWQLQCNLQQPVPAWTHGAAHNLLPVNRGLECKHGIMPEG